MENKTRNSNIDKEIKSTRTVYQCKICANKTIEKPEACENDKIKCTNKIFITRKMYCVDKIKSYKAFMNCIVGRRRGGKSYAVIEYFISLWKTERKKFVWIRRYKTETIRALDAVKKFGYLFDKFGVYYEKIEIINKDDKNENKTKNKKEKTKINKVYIGYIITLSTTSRVRGGEFPDVFRIGWDEYGDEAGGSWMDETTLFNSLVVSIFDEKSDCEAWVLSNKVNRFLPIYQKVKVRWDEEWTYNWQCDAVVHVTQDDGFDMIGSASKWIKNSLYYNYAFHNKAMDEDNWLIETYKIEFVKPEFCFKLGIIKANLSVYLTKDYVVIGECDNCNHQVNVIDYYNRAFLIKNINESICNKLINYYHSKKLKFTLPQIKDEFFSWLNRRGFE